MKEHGIIVFHCRDSGLSSSTTAFPLPTATPHPSCFAWLRPGHHPPTDGLPGDLSPPPESHRHLNPPPGLSPATLVNKVSGQLKFRGLSHPEQGRGEQEEDRAGSLAVVTQGPKERGWSHLQLPPTQDIKKKMAGRLWAGKWQMGMSLLSQFSRPGGLSTSDETKQKAGEGRVGREARRAQQPSSLLNQAWTCR